MRKVAVILIVLCKVCVLVEGNCEVTLQQNHGSVTGYGLLQQTPSGGQFCSFLSIPFAEPPIGNLRFELPQPLDLFIYAREWYFTEKSPICIQNRGAIDVDGQEDCLYLNVFVKVTQSVTPKPVIVWVFGGWYQFGSAYSVSADRMDYLVDQDVIVVTFNYRLGALGFLYREHDNFIGNLGLHDQLEAFKWVNKNIAYFGGDPNKVTLMGWSAGSAAVSHHIQAPASAGLFSAAIMMSGSKLNAWAYNSNTQSCTKALCKSLNVPCNYGSLKNVLKTLPAEVFQTQKFGQETTISLFGERIFCFVPTAEGQEATYTGTAMVQDEQQRLLQHRVWNDVPILMGYTTAEIIAINPMNMETLSARWNKSFPFTQDNIMKPLRKYLYDGAKELNNESQRLMVQVMDIHGFKQYIDYYRDNASSDIFFYRFSHKNSSNTFGAAHGDDLRYLFVPVNDRPITQADLIVRERMVRYITNFAKYRDPTPKKDAYITERWIPYGKSGLRMEISSESKMVKEVKEPLYHRWDAIYQCLQFGNCNRFFKVISSGF